MTILVTGGCGFVGAFVVKRIAADGRDVVAFDSGGNSDLLDSILTPQESKHVTVVRGDLLDLPHMLRLAREKRLEGIVHLAYMISISTMANPAWSQQVNIVGTNNIFELALAAGGKRVAWASTVDVFGPRSLGADGTIDDNAPYDPTNIYGACKMLNEVSAMEYAKNFGLDAFALRLPAVFGPGTTRSWTRFIPQLIEALVKKEVGVAPSYDKIMPWAYVEDIAEAFNRALNTKGHVDRALTLAGKEESVVEIVKMVRKLFPNGEIRLEDFQGQGAMPRYLGGDAKGLLGWDAKISFEEGLRRIADYYRRKIGK